MYDKHYLTPLFEPQSVVVIGASERPGAIGGMVLRNIVEAGYRGKLYAVNPKHANVSGVRCYSSVADLPEKTDLAVVATPAPTIAAVIEACGKAGIRTAYRTAAEQCMKHAAKIHDYRAVERIAHAMRASGL